jgi:DNA-binding MarR family transcriptional regulator
MSTQTDIPAAAAEQSEACPEATVGVPGWSQEQAEAWSGFHAVHNRVVKTLEHELGTRHGIGISGYKLLARLSRSEQGGGLRMSELADDALLSPSRVSRLVDQLERDGYIERRPCAQDSRVVFATITPEGTAYLAEIHETYVAAVERGFFDQLSETEVKTLARVWSRLSNGA